MEANQILLTPAEHKQVMLNVRVTLTWYNLAGSFIGPYISTEDYQLYIKNS